MARFTRKLRRIEIMEKAPAVIVYTIPEVVFSDGTVVRDLSQLSFRFSARKDIDSPTLWFEATSETGSIAIEGMEVRVQIPASAISSVPQGTVFYGELDAINPLTDEVVPVWDAESDAPVIEFYVWGTLR